MRKILRRIHKMCWSHSQQMSESNISEQVQVKKDEVESGISNSPNISYRDVHPLVTISTDESTKHGMLYIDNGSPDTDVNIGTKVKDNYDKLQHHLPVNSTEKESTLGNLENKGDNVLNQRDTSDTFIRLGPQEKKKISFSNKLYLAPLTINDETECVFCCKWAIFPSEGSVRDLVLTSRGEMDVGTNFFRVRLQSGPYSNTMLQKIPLEYT